MPYEGLIQVIARGFALKMATIVSDSSPTYIMNRADIYYAYIMGWAPHKSPEEGGTKGIENG